MCRNLSRLSFAALLGLLSVDSAFCVERHESQWPPVRKLKAMESAGQRSAIEGIFKASTPEEHYTLLDLAEIITLAGNRQASVDSEIAALFERLAATKDLGKTPGIADCLTIATAIGDSDWTSFSKGKRAAATFLETAVCKCGMEASRKAFAAVSFASGWPKGGSNRSANEKAGRLYNQRRAMFRAMSAVWIDRRLNELSAKRTPLPQCPPFAGEVPKDFAEQYGPEAVASFKELVRVHDWIRDIRMKSGADIRDEKKRNEAKQVDFSDADWQRLMDDFFADPGSVPMDRLMRFTQKPENSDVSPSDVYRTQKTLIEMIRLHNADLASIVGEMTIRSGDGVVVRPGWALERVLPLTEVNLDTLLAAQHLPLVAQFNYRFFAVIDGASPFRDAAIGARVALAVEKTMPASKSVVWKWIEAERSWERAKIEKDGSEPLDPLWEEPLLGALFSYVAMNEPALPEELIEAIQAAITRRYRAETKLLQRRMMQKMAVRYCPAWEELAQELRKSRFNFDVATAEQTMSRWGRPFVPTPPRVGPGFDIHINGEHFDLGKLPDPDEFGKPSAEWEANLEVDAPAPDGKPWPSVYLHTGGDGIPGIRDESARGDGVFSINYDAALTLLETGKPLRLVLRPASRDPENWNRASLGETSFAVPWIVVPVKLPEDLSKTSVIEVTAMRLAVELKIPEAVRGQLYNTVLHLQRLDVPLRKRGRADFPSIFRVSESVAYVFSHLQPGRYSLRIEATGGSGNGAVVWENNAINLAPGNSVVTAELQAAP